MKEADTISQIVKGNSSVVYLFWEPTNYNICRIADK